MCENLNLLTTDHFENIINLFDLKPYIDYYKLYNFSHYINSYHGFEHVKRVICSIYELSKPKVNTNVLNKEEIKELMVAAIFHDFNYIGVNHTNPEYDHQNVIEAVRSFQIFCRFSNLVNSEQKLFCDNVENYILKTEYPKCFSIFLTEKEKILLAADHSMIIYQNYEYMALMFSINECRLTQKDEIIENAKKYISNANLPNEYFQEILENNRKKIISKFEGFVVRYLNSIRIENLVNYNKSNILSHIDPNISFEFVKPNF